ncbi:Receptor-like serine/threonine-protein kinase ALE2 [Zea mays]|uniref:Receptor-like serine/threonine-protein kinase ALE2 n=1 Tax=Zea mays TaxID=4577 RepID=A0A3L6FKH8_MAIZE|nr:Receptor-like serine/threonine-protein kinase ALE2 [Zea mays]
MARLGRAGCRCSGPARGIPEDTLRNFMSNVLPAVLILEFLSGTNLIVQTFALEVVAPAMPPFQGWGPFHSLASQTKVLVSVSAQPDDGLQRQKKLYSSAVAMSSTHPPISAPSYRYMPGALDLAIYSSDLSRPPVQHTRHLATAAPAHVDADPPDAASNSSAAPLGLVQPPVSPHSGCCAPNMVQKRGTRDCHCVYPVRIELFLRNVSLTSNWSNKFLQELASQLNLRVNQFEIVNFYVVGASGLNITMDIAPYTGISFAADQVKAMNYSLTLHTVRIDPVLVGDYNLLNLTWFRSLAPAPDLSVLNCDGDNLEGKGVGAPFEQGKGDDSSPAERGGADVRAESSGTEAPAFTMAPRASPSTASTFPRQSEGPSNNRHASLITVVIICVGSLIGVLLIVLTICFCTFRKRKKRVPHVETPKQRTADAVSTVESLPRPTSTRFLSYEELKVATNNFEPSSVLGEGGFGRVFKGVLGDGTAVAIKKLTNGGHQGDKEFLVEVEMLSRYVAPEYAMTGHLLVKSDVYSYGVVLLELLTGRRPVDMSQPSGQENLVTWARPILRDQDRLGELADPRLGGQYPKDDFVRVCTIAAACVSPEANQRPTMGEVVQSLKMVQRSVEFQESVPTPPARPNVRQSSTTYESDGTSSMFSSGPFSGLSPFETETIPRTAVFSEDLHEGR